MSKTFYFSNNALHDFWLGSLEKPIVVEFLYICHFEENILKSTFTEIGVDLKMLKSQCPIMIDDKQAVSFIKNTPYEKLLLPIRPNYVNQILAGTKRLSIVQRFVKML